MAIIFADMPTDANECREIIVILKRPGWLGRSFILGKFTLARETFWVQTFRQLSAAFIS